ncbi:MAG: hypothetical protein IJQ80_05210 [Clostridia bacterium]|nr:hypothetical protein [Clostridia bacterium]
MFGFWGCKNKDKKEPGVTTASGAEKYKVDYSGQKDYFTGAKDEYKVGETVTVYYGLIATDTDYWFTLDGEKLNCAWDDDNGYVIEFTMPSHDVVLECHSRNSMVYEPYSEGDILVDYYIGTVGTDGGDSYRELVLSYIDFYQAKLEVITYSAASGVETVTEYTVPYDAINMCFEAIDEEDFRSWADLEDYECLDGAITSLGYLDRDGEYIKVSTDKMPQDGESALDRVGAVLAEYIKNEYLTDKGDSN